MRKPIQLFGLAALIALTTSCGNVVRQGRSPAYLVIDTLQAAPGNKPSSLGSGLASDVIVLVTTPAPCSSATPCPTIFGDVGQVELGSSLKDVGSTTNPVTPTTNNDITITGYHVKYIRADGHNTQGVDVPYEFDGAATGTVSVGGKLSLGFTLVRNVAKEESPLVQLVSNPNIITAIAQVTFYGKDAVGNDVSVMGQIQVDFGNFGDS